MYGYEQDETEETPLIKQLRKQLDAQAREKTELEKQLGQLQGQVKTQSVREILREAGIKPKVANLVPKDVEPTAESVLAWVKEYEDVLGTSVREVEKAETSEVPSVPANEPARPNVDDATQNAFRRVQSSEAAAGATTPDREAAQLAALATLEGKSSTELIDIFTRGNLPTTP